MKRLSEIVLSVKTGAVRTTPSTAVSALLGLKPLHLTIKAVTAKAALRLGGPEGGREMVVFLN